MQNGADCLNTLYALLNKCNFSNDICFKHCECYEDFIANYVIFKGNVYFDSSIFRRYSDFHENTLGKTAYFYIVVLKEVPNFSAYYFKEPRNVNLINLDINIFDSAHYIVWHKDEAIYIVKAIINNNIQNLLKAIYIDVTKNDILKSTNIIYSIILLLCIFSLQKNCTEKFYNSKLERT